MTNKLIAAILASVTLVAIVWLPTPGASSPSRNIDAGEIRPVVAARPVIDAVFVLDTTGSMSGLIQTAKEKIWSIASTMASARPAPRIRIGLVAYRDRGDDYVVRTVELSEDLDAVYAELMQFQAAGGGDGPESVNAALDAAVNQLNWSDQQQAYKVVFLVGDAPPHMDYQDEVRYPAILASARDKGIVVNAIQCGDVPTTAAPWSQIASLGGGTYFQVEQAGGAVAMSTPFDSELAALSAKLDETRLYYGTAAEREELSFKLDSAKRIDADASEEARARRGVFNLSEAGRASQMGRNELVSAIESGEVDLEALDESELPEPLKPMAPEAQADYVQRLAEERKKVKSRMQELAEARDDFLREKVEEAGGAESSLDQKLYDTISRQSVTAGLEYDGGPAY